LSKRREGRRQAEMDRRIKPKFVRAKYEMGGKKKFKRTPQGKNKKRKLNRVRAETNELG